MYLLNTGFHLLSPKMSSYVSDFDFTALNTKKYSDDFESKFLDKSIKLIRFGSVDFKVESQNPSNCCEMTFGADGKVVAALKDIRPMPWNRIIRKIEDGKYLLIEVCGKNNVAMDDYFVVIRGGRIDFAISTPYIFPDISVSDSVQAAFVMYNHRNVFRGKVFHFVHSTFAAMSLVNKEHCLTVRVKVDGKVVASKGYSDWIDYSKIFRFMRAGKYIRVAMVDGKLVETFDFIYLNKIGEVDFERWTPFCISKLVLDNRDIEFLPAKEKLNALVIEDKIAEEEEEKQREEQGEEEKCEEHSVVFDEEDDANCDEIDAVINGGVDA